MSSTAPVESIKDTHKKSTRRGYTRVVEPESFEAENHYYPRVLNATIHPVVASFLNMGNERIITRYCHLNPQVKPEALREIFAYQPQHFRWSGCDLFNVTTAGGKREVVVIETNSCPSGQKSFPLASEVEEMGGYKRLLETTFKSLIAAVKDDIPDGVLAVVYDKNFMEASGYAATMAEITGEKVYLVEHYVADEEPPVQWRDGVMYIRSSPDDVVGTDPSATSGRAIPAADSCTWLPVRAAFRYVTQRPWTRIPISCKTKLLNPILPCLAGGRNKLMAAKAYDFFNAELMSTSSGLKIKTPETIRDVTKAEVPLWVERFQQAVVKVPYSNAGQGVYTILSKAELDEFMAEEHHYDKFVVQSLIGNSSWSSVSTDGKRYYHIGTVPDRKNKIYVADVRMMVCATDKGFRPLALYARRAAKPLVDHIDPDAAAGFSWEMLGTNLSKAVGDMKWDTETARLMLMDRKDFNLLGIGIDDIIESYVQTLLSTIAIDKMCQKLVHEDGSFNLDLFQSLNDDAALIAELKH